MEITIDSGGKPVKSATTSLIDPTNKDVDEKVMILGQVIKIMKGVCDKSKGMREARIVIMKITKGVINSVLQTIHWVTKLVIVED